MERTQILRFAGTQKCVLGLALLAAAIGAASCHASTPPADPAGAEALPVLVESLGDYRYEYHLPSGREFLYDGKNDERGLVNLLRGHRAEAARCREALEARLGPGGIEAMRSRYRDTIQHLRALGYL